VSRTASRLAAVVLAAGALVTVAALPASAAEQHHGRHAGFGHGFGHGRHHEQRADVVIDVHHTYRGARSNRALNDEWVTVTNESRRSVNLDRWTLTDSDHHVYRFSYLTLRGHESVRVHTGAGRDTDRDLYQDRRSAEFGGRDTATLRDARGHVVDTDSSGRGRR
jgi:lamin tail-like protein